MVRIFLADHHVLIRGGLRTLLKARRGFAICGESGNGFEAVKLAIQAKPDVVIIDVNLPGINGIEATRQIRRARPHTEILIFTTENNEDVMREAMHAGARGYLLKSASDDQIVTAIEALARHEGYRSASVSEKLLESLTHSKHSDSDWTRLTTREREILRLIAEGHRGREIALMLGVSQKTVGSHRAAGMRKLDLHSIAEVVHYAIREKLIQM